ncbi:MAG: hypothetical protein ACXWNS_07700, partial [Isosphaeraceae bacterium]
MKEHSKLRRQPRCRIVYPALMLVNDPQGTIAMKSAPHSALESQARILPSMLIALTMCAAAGPAPPAHETERRVDGLLARMTLQEKVGQL